MSRKVATGSPGSAFFPLISKPRGRRGSLTRSTARPPVPILCGISLPFGSFDGVGRPGSKSTGAIHVCLSSMWNDLTWTMLPFPLLPHIVRQPHSMHDAAARPVEPNEPPNPHEACTSTCRGLLPENYSRSNTTCFLPPFQPSQSPKGGRTRGSLSSRGLISRTSYPAVTRADTSTR